MLPLFTGTMASTSKKPSRAGIKYCARQDPKPCGVEINPNDPHDRCLRHNITCFPDHQYDLSTCEPCLSIIKGYKDNNKLSRAIFAERITSMQKSFRRVGKTQKLPPDAQACHDVSQGCDIWAPSAKHLDPRTRSVSASPVPPTPLSISPREALQTVLHLPCWRPPSRPFLALPEFLLLLEPLLLLLALTQVRSWLLLLSTALRCALPNVAAGLTSASTSALTIHRLLAPPPVGIGHKKLPNPIWPPFMKLLLTSLLPSLPLTLLWTPLLNRSTLIRLQLLLPPKVISPTLRRMKTTRTPRANLRMILITPARVSMMIIPTFQMTPLLHVPLAFRSMSLLTLLPPTLTANSTFCPTTLNSIVNSPATEVTKFLILEIST